MFILTTADHWLSTSVFRFVFLAFSLTFLSCEFSSPLVPSIWCWEVTGRMLGTWAPKQHVHAMRAWRTTLCFFLPWFKYFGLRKGGLSLLVYPMLYYYSGFKSGVSLILRVTSQTDKLYVQYMSSCSNSFILFTWNVSFLLKRKSTEKNLNNLRVGRKLSFGFGMFYSMIWDKKLRE